MLLSFINMQLRDNYPSLKEFCDSTGVSEEEIKEKLQKINYIYDEDQNRFA